jgi:nitrite reductase/ring-hydroxylating ferredoxin subunit
MHVLKIRVLKSTTYVNNDGANVPAGQVPMDTDTSATPGFAKALCRLDEIPDGGATAVDAILVDGEENVILLRQGKAVQAYLNICPHAGRRLDYAPGKFLLKGDTLICAVHGASFNKFDGLCIIGLCRGERLQRVKVSVEGEIVQLAS